MSMIRPFLLVCGLLAACDRAKHEHSSQDEALKTPAPAPSHNEAATSIIRPEVAEESGVPGLSSTAVVPLRAVIPFPETGAQLDGDARARIDALIAAPHFASGGEITLAGHSDASGSDSENLETSRRRAEAVRDYLLSKGVPSDRMTVVAMGERRPVEPNAHPDGSDYPEGRIRNRRVEIIIAPPSPPSPAISPPDAPVKGVR